jgi:hypothetical protein
MKIWIVLYLLRISNIKPHKTVPKFKHADRKTDMISVSYRAYFFISQKSNPNNRVLMVYINTVMWIYKPLMKLNGLVCSIREFAPRRSCDWNLVKSELYIKTQNYICFICLYICNIFIYLSYIQVYVHVSSPDYRTKSLYV